jgi:L-ascorbate metabolism protein UlaG (beta-lactamase superfamily)
MHYDTFPVIRADAAAFARKVEKRGLAARVVAPGAAVAV